MSSSSSSPPTMSGSTGKTAGISDNGSGLGRWNSTEAIGKLWGMSGIDVDGGDGGGHK